MIEIDIAPNLFTGALSISWHGFFSFIAIGTAVLLVGRWAPLRGVDPDAIYSIAIWAIIGGFIGARLVHVIDSWDFYGQNLMRIPAIWSGGIGVWGGVLGGFIGGLTSVLVDNYLRRRRLERARSRGNAPAVAQNQPLPFGVIADLTAPALLIVQTIGRLGDIVNGEHCAKATDWFIGFIWTNPGTLAETARYCNNGVSNAVHPAIIYEMAWNMLALAIIWNLRGRLKPDGMLFALYLALYAIGRFVISFSRIEDQVWALGLLQAQYIALVVLALAVPLLVAKARLTARQEEVPVAVQRGTRAARRRRRRQ